MDVSTIQVLRKLLLVEIEHEPLVLARLKLEEIAPTTEREFWLDLTRHLCRELRDVREDLIRVIERNLAPTVIRIEKPHA
jgi:hypothetical protein